MQITNPEVKNIFDELNEKLDKTVDVLSADYADIRTGRANPHILDKIMVDYYGTMSPINQVGNLNVPESRSITIAPWDASMLSKIEKAILQANIGLTPTNDGKLIRLVFPEVTEERRRDLVKNCKNMAEEAKIAVRNVRREAMDKLKKMKTAKTISEDDVANYEKEVEKVVTTYIDEVDSVYKTKEKEVMSV
ncbi:MAG: ribosome recycling factor [Clostridia bacterium]